MNLNDFITLTRVLMLKKTNKAGLIKSGRRVNGVQTVDSQSLT